MVKLHIKRGDESQFLYETTVEASLAELVTQLVRLHNGRFKVDRLCQGWALGWVLIGDYRYFVEHGGA